MRTNLLAILTLSCAAFAQHVSFGIVGGAGLTDDFRDETSTLTTIGGPVVAPIYTHQYSTKKDYIVGAMVSVGLPGHLSVEADGLYRPMNFTIVSSSVVGSNSSAPSNTVVTWEFPVLLKYKLPAPFIKPFAELGPSFRTAGNLNDTSPSHHGVTLGVGVEPSFGRFKVAPTIRYTRWAEDQPSQSFPVARTNPNQAEFLVGLSF